MSKISTSRLTMGQEPDGSLTATPTLDVRSDFEQTSEAALCLCRRLRLEDPVEAFAILEKD
jgi:hypothetical protein